tara:strand:- start:1794 stop:2123 length:330 start_codon:yes stop_codon:yes gene_type:complete
MTAKVLKVHKHIGAIIKHVDLTEPMSKETANQIIRAFHAHSVLIFKNQDITPPLGLLLFFVSPMARITLEKASLAVLPFLAAEISILLLIAFVPDITMAIPKMTGLALN